jgi:hypothetical protein
MDPDVFVDTDSMWLEATDPFSPYGFGGEIMDDKMWVLATRSIPELVKALEPLVPPQPPEELG